MWKVCSFEIFQCLPGEDTSNSYIFIKGYLLDAPSKFPQLCSPEVCRLPSVCMPPEATCVLLGVTTENVSGSDWIFFILLALLQCQSVISDHLASLHSPGSFLGDPSPQSQCSSSDQWEEFWGGMDKVWLLKRDELCKSEFGVSTVLKSRSVLFQNSLAILGSLHFHMNFRISRQLLHKKTTGVLVGILLLG